MLDDLGLRGARLRALREDDAEELGALIDREREHLAAWLPWARDATPADTLAFVRAARGQAEAGDGEQSAVVVDGRIAGAVGAHAISQALRSTSLGYWLAREHQGRGIMTAAVRAYVDHAFTDWGLHRVELRAAVENARSRAIAERVGFRQEGVLRDAERVGDRFHDLAVYGLLAGEWSG